MQTFERNDNKGKQMPAASQQRSCLIAAIAFFCLMVAIGSLPGTANALSAVVYDKLLHFTAYALLSTLVYAGLRGTPASRALRTLAIIFILGSIDETIQLLLPYRSPNWLDWKFDMLAAMTCVGMLMLLHPVVAARAGGRSAMDTSRPERKP